MVFKFLGVHLVESMEKGLQGQMIKQCMGLLGKYRELSNNKQNILNLVARHGV